MYCCIDFFSYDLYQEKKMYEEYISIDVYNDMHALVASILESNKLYEDQGFITRYDAHKLRKNAYKILEIPQTYGSLASNFGRIESGMFQNETAEQVAQIGHFFFEMNGSENIDEDHVNEVIFELNDDMKKSSG